MSSTYPLLPPLACPAIGRGRRGGTGQGSSREVSTRDRTRRPCLATSVGQGRPRAALRHAAERPYGDLLALPFEGAAGGEDFLREIGWDVGKWGAGQGAPQEPRERKGRCQRRPSRPSRVP